MPITALTDPALLPNKTMDQQAFDNAMAYMIRNMPLRAQQENELAANLNSIAVGGAYAIPYKVSGSSSDIGKGGFFTLQGNNDSLYFDDVDSAGNSVKAILINLFSGSSGVKATLKLTSVADPSRYIIWNILGYTPSAGSTLVSAQLIADTNAGRNLTTAIAIFTRTGEKGDTGPINPLPFAMFRDQRGSNVAAQSLTAQAWTPRVINTVNINSIVGFSITNNVITLPAGTFLWDISAGASSTGKTVLRLFNVTDNSSYDIGVGGSYPSGGSSGILTHKTYTNFSSSKSFRIEQYVSDANALGGTPVSAGQGEIYLDARIIKTL